MNENEQDEKPVRPNITQGDKAVPKDAKDMIKKELAHTPGSDEFDQLNKLTQKFHAAKTDQERAVIQLQLTTLAASLSAKESHDKED